MIVLDPFSCSQANIIRLCCVLDGGTKSQMIVSHTSPWLPACRMTSKHPQLLCTHALSYMHGPVTHAMMFACAQCAAAVLQPPITGISLARLTFCTLQACAPLCAKIKGCKYLISIKIDLIQNMAFTNFTCTTTGHDARVHSTHSGYLKNTDNTSKTPPGL